jgi:prepilin-type N-terminal cleavage/methylation domain-containing protein/prepilin-type processing-associated H-X9-DG protein
MVGQRRGFTLIELLVVIAIIGILAALLFPVFARTRESARKTQCLANVKNIAMAIQIYLSDYDRFPPDSHDTEELAWLNSVSPSGQGCSELAGFRWQNRNRANPYLRHPVILDEYVRSRDVWLCPSGRVVGVAAWIVPQYTPVFWWYLRDHGFGPGCGPCTEAWPPGWGGVVTDSVVQGMKGIAKADPTAFHRSIGTTVVESYNRSTAEIGDPAQWVVCGDNEYGDQSGLLQAWTAAYASACCQGLTPGGCCTTEEALRYFSDVSFRRQFAPHMGGLNLGFADGHAKWWSAEAAIQQAGGCYGYAGPSLDLHGFCLDFAVPGPGVR